VISTENDVENCLRQDRGAPLHAITTAELR
jgi:hypothetical protein